MQEYFELEGCVLGRIFSSDPTVGDGELRQKAEMLWMFGPAGNDEQNRIMMSELTCRYLKYNHSLPESDRFTLKQLANHIASLLPGAKF